MNNSNAPKILVLAEHDFACIRISGRANFGSSVDFRTLVNELIAKGCKYFILDLTECLLMDSTFLGVLAGLGLRLGGPQPREEAKAVELRNPTPRVAELLETLGVLHLFKVVNGVPPGSCAGEAKPHQPIEASREDLTRASLEAHETLMRVNPENVARFKDVTRFLAEDLRKPKSTTE